MMMQSIVKSFFLAIAMLLAASTLLSCSVDAFPPVASATQSRPKLDTLPPAFREVMAEKSEKDQQEFFALPIEHRQAIIDEWERREKVMRLFKPAEQTIISNLSEDESDKFFKIAENQKDQQEQFLADAETRYLDLIEDCLAKTHRRIGRVSKANVDEQSLKDFSAPERVVISRLTTDEAKTFSGLPAKQREQFLSDTVDRKMGQLVSCPTRLSQHLDDPSEAPQ